MKPEPPSTPRNQPAALRTSHVQGDRVYLRPIQVTPVGRPGFAVGVNGVPVRVELPVAGCASAVVHVSSPLAFDGVARADDVPVYVVRAAELTSGRVRVTAGMRVRSATTTAAGVVADIVMAPGVVAREVVVPEDLLTLDFTPRSPGVAGAGAWQPRGSTVQLRPSDGGGAPITVEVSSPIALVLEWQGDERDGLVLVTARWNDGAALTGRVSRTELREIGASETFAAAELVERTPGIVDECGLQGTPRGVVRGVRRVRAGAAIYAEPGRGAWARLTNAADLEVEYTADARFAAIVKTPGIVLLGAACTEVVRAWVEARALSIPPGAR